MNRVLLVGSTLILAFSRREKGQEGGERKGRADVILSGVRKKGNDDDGEDG